MTSLEKARKFLKDGVKRTALVVVPLAAAAVHANAGVILAPSNPLPFFQNQGGPTGDQVNVTNLSPVLGFTGVKLSGTSVDNIFASGGGQYIYATASGGATGATGVPLAAIINFTFTATSGAGSGGGVYWDVQGFLGTSAGNYTGEVFGQAPSPSNGLITGSLVLRLNGNGTSVIPQGTTITDWSLTVGLDVCSFNNAGCLANDSPNITLSIPSNSIDLTAQTAVPEPSTYVLMGSGIAGFAFLRLRKRGASRN